MNELDRGFADLAAAYEKHAPLSAELHRRAGASMVDGGSHSVRLNRPFPPRIAKAGGAWVEDEDGHRMLDFWQGHFANILGHNPPVVTERLAEAFAGGWGLQTGFTDRLQIETAEILCRQTGAERVRFTTSGTLATMYSILLARGYTGRSLVVKAGGGWHGAQPWGFKGVHYEAPEGFTQVETVGVPPEVTDQILVTRFNDTQMLEDYFHRHGDQIACFIVEPFIGAGGFLPATREFLHAARALTRRYGALLICDEVICGFRFRAGNLAALYDVQPDLASFAKIAGGGMPVAAVAGTAAVMNCVGREAGAPVRFSGGTYSGHPASLLAAHTMLTYLVEHEAEIYPRLAEAGRRARSIVEEAFAEAGILVRCSGAGNDVVPGSSLMWVNFPYKDAGAVIHPDELFDPAHSNTRITQGGLLQLALLLEDTYLLMGHGSLSLAHGEEEMEQMRSAFAGAARRLQPYIRP